MNALATRPLTSAFFFLLFAGGCAGSRDDGTASGSSAAISSRPTTEITQPQPQPASQVERDPRVVAADLSRIDGADTAGLWVLIVSDFQCPYCKDWHDQVSKEFHREFVSSGKVRLAYIHFPLSIHQNAVPAAEASMCAGAQGGRRFWDMHNRIFDSAVAWSQSEAPQATFEFLARDLGLDIEAFNKCLADDVMLPMIDADRQRGRSAGVRSTPSFLVGSSLLSGAAPLEALREAVNRELARQ
ncbi:MAG: DsbA family protein [Gemmatimonadota bacterium]